MMTDALRLAAEVPCDPRTARKWLEGGEVRSAAIVARLTEAAKRLGLKQERKGKQS